MCSKLTLFSTLLLASAHSVFAAAPPPPAHVVAASGPTAEEALDLLKKGNERFRVGKPTHPHGSIERVKETAVGQKPFAIVLGCADSRIPSEIIFD